MGEQSARLRAFRADNPICYFCATRPTQTQDHVPSRESFYNKIGPEGFIFPACTACNNSAGRLEQVVALYLILSNHGFTSPSVNQFKRIVQGVNNNTPALMPTFDQSPNAARRHYRNKGMRLNPGQTFNEVPIITLPNGYRDAFELFARRLTCALYYKEVGAVLPLDRYIITSWMPWTEASFNDIIEKALTIFPALTMANRRNTDIGEQFCYRWAVDESNSVFGFVAQFSHSYFFFGAAVTSKLHEDNNGGVAGWKLHFDDVTF